MIRSLQSLRFVFIYLVVISHFVNRTFDFGGECGVSFFFMLSGFVLSLANAGRIGQGTYSTRGLFMRQLFKVYPLHILTMAIMLVMEWRLGNGYSPMVLLTNVLLVQSWVPSDDFYFVANGSSWFLCDILLLSPLSHLILLHHDHEAKGDDNIRFCCCGSIYINNVFCARATRKSHSICQSHDAHIGFLHRYIDI